MAFASNMLFADHFINKRKTYKLLCFMIIVYLMSIMNDRLIRRCGMRSDGGDKKAFMLTFPLELVERIDVQAKSLCSTRTQYIRDSVVMRLNRDFGQQALIPTLNELKYKQLGLYLQENIRNSDLKHDIR